MFFVIVKTYIALTDVCVDTKTEIVNVFTSFKDANNFLYDYSVPETDIDPRNYNFYDALRMTHVSYTCKWRNSSISPDIDYSVGLRIACLDDEPETVFQLLIQNIESVKQWEVE